MKYVVFSLQIVFIEIKKIEIAYEKYFLKQSHFSVKCQPK